MSESSEPDRAYEALSLACMAVGALAWAWGFFAMQAPSSPWHLGGMPYAVERLAAHAWITGLVIAALTRGASPPRWVLYCTASGVALSLCAQAVSAATGLLGVQVRDLRSWSGAVLSMRVVGGACLAVAWASIGAQRLRRR